MIRGIKRRGKKNTSSMTPQEKTQLVECVIESNYRETS